MSGVPGIESAHLHSPMLVGVALLWTVFQVSLVPNCVFALCTIFDGPSSLYLEFVLPVFG